MLTNDNESRVFVSLMMADGKSQASRRMVRVQEVRSSK